MNTLKIISYAVISLYVAVNIALYFFQTRLLFHPSKLSKSFRFTVPTGTTELFLKTTDGETINALYYAGQRDETILYLHGNAGDLSGWKFVVDTFAAAGYSILMIDYRGYGKSTGEISEQGIYEDAATAYRFLTTDKQLAPGSVIVYGRSLGTGPAVELASTKHVRALVLESPFTSMKKLANEKLPLFFPSLYMRYHFDNITKISKIKVPVVLVHGTADELIPASHSERIYAAVPTRKKMILVHGAGHNDLGEFAEHQQFIQSGLAEFISAD